MCRTYRIPHSTLIAGGPDQWDDVDAALAIAYEQWRRLDQAARCHTCGTRPEDWTDEGGHHLLEPAWDLEDVTCEGCRRRDARQEELRTAGDTAGRTVRFRAHIPESDIDDDDLVDSDLIVYRWQPDDPLTEADGLREGLTLGSESVAPLAALGEKAAAGWVVARGPDDKPMRASRPDAGRDGTV